MTISSYTTFTLNNLLYGIDTIFVEEIFYLPEIIVVPEVPNDIIGVINLRGNIVPIMDLNYRFGYQTSRDYQLSDSVIVLRWLNLRVGILVNQVHDVRTIVQKEINPDLSYHQTLIQEPEEKFIKGIADNNNELIIILDIEKLLTYVEEQNINMPEESFPDIEDKNNIVPSKLTQFCPNASAKEREIFHNRAHHLKTQIKEEIKTELQTIAIIELRNELFGFDVTLVQEFITIRRITPIPCAEDYIIGNINFRGEILTLVDISSFLNISPLEINNNSPAMLIKTEDLTYGIVVSNICDIFSFDRQKLLETTNSLQEVNQTYNQGIISYQERMVTLIDLKEIVKTTQVT